jgi:S-DNA-T family DNA segregation ATPase FtsK/SpoIIIE
MRKEIIGILLFFLLVFTLVSLLSYSPLDPSLFDAGGAGKIHNLFGLFGAHLAAVLIGVFGLGAFWIPLLLLLTGIHILGAHPRATVINTVAGGLLLVLTTGALLSLRQHGYELFGSNYSAGGLAGIPLKSFLVTYSNRTGAVIILGIIWLIGFMMATGFSVLAFGARCRAAGSAAVDYLKTVYLKHRERRQKVKKRRKAARQQAVKRQPPLKIVSEPRPPIKKAPKAKQEVFEFMRPRAGFQLPSISFLEEPESLPVSADNENLRMQSRLLEKKLEDFGVRGRVAAVSPGPVITTFEYEPAAGIKINKIVTLADDLALALRAGSIRIVAPIPGKSVIGIEVPNAVREMVRFREIAVSETFEKSTSQMTLCLGKDIVGNPFVAELERMPHLLIAGATGAGKSVALNTMICSLLYKAGPDEVKLIMVDPKRIELSHYDGIPHLITPVVTDVKKATNALFWAVREMERRYELLSDNKARNIVQYNRKVASQRSDAPDDDALQSLPFIVIIIDELADLMMVASRDVEVALTRLAQMARAAGLHLILATQRPSVDVLTGIIKANFPTRLSFQVSSKTDSRTIIDTNGAENLLGNGDMLFMPPGTAKLQRIHGAYISETEMARITEFLKNQKQPEYDHEVTEPVNTDEDGGTDAEADEKYDEAVALVTRTRQASISMVQRHLRIGYNRAARIIEMMEKEGVVGPSDGAKPRDVLVGSYDNPR